MYELNSFFVYKALFMLALLVAQSLMVFRLKRRPYFVLRAVASVAVCIGRSLALPVLDDGALFSSALFMTMFVISAGALWSCFDAEFGIIVFCALAGYTTQHIAYQVFDIAVIAMGLHNMQSLPNIGSNPLNAMFPLTYGSASTTVGNVFVLIMFFASNFVSYWTVYRIVEPRMRDSANLRLENVSVLVIVGVIMLIDVVLSAVVTQYGNIEFNMVYLILLDATNILCCVLAMCQQFSVARMRRLGADLETVGRMWEQEREQYRLTKENINMINMNCHDLKHQIRTIAGKNSISPEAVGEIEKIISIYDSGMKTGSAALDIILTEKSLYCNSHKITLSVIADGGALSFIPETDLYSLFGNLIDNAIEAVGSLDDERKVISLSIKKVNDFVFVNIRNYYDGELVFEAGGLPVTTKNDKINHGYGMKSIKMLINKYGGEMGIDTTSEAGIFNLSAVFPL